MKQTYTSVLLLLIILLLPTSVRSSEIDISEKNIAHPDVDIVGKRSGAATLAKELLIYDTQELALDALSKQRSIQYIPTVGIMAGTMLTFKCTNCTIKNSAGQLYIVDKEGDLKALLIDYETDDAGNYTSVTFAFTKFTTFYNAAAPNTGNLFLSLQYTADTIVKQPKAPLIIVDKGLQRGETATIEVSEAKIGWYDQELPHLKTQPEDLVKVVDGIVGEIKQPAYSVIDVKEDQLQFVPGKSTEKFSSSASGIELNATVAEVGLIYAGDDVYTLIIERNDGCWGVDDDANAIKLYPALPPPFSFEKSESFCKWEWRGTFDDATGKALTKEGLEAFITVNGKEMLELGDWKITLKVKPLSLLGDEADTFMVFGQEVSHSWSLNGAKIKIPDMRTSLVNGIYLIITNRSDKDAKVYLDVYSDQNQQSGTSQMDKACSNVLLSAIPANSVATYYPNELNRAIDNTIGCADFSMQNKRYLGVFLFEADPDDIDVVALQKDGQKGKRVIPAYTDRNKYNLGN